MKATGKKFTKRVLSIVLGAVLAFGLASCGGAGESGGGNGGGNGGIGGELKISIARLGYGTDWLFALKDEFEKETGVKVTIVSKVGDSAVGALQTEVESLASKTDLFFNRQGTFSKKVFEGGITVKGKNYDCLYEDLSDVWNSVVDEGTTKTIKDKMDETYESSFNIEGKYYSLPWAGGVLGFARNLSVWNGLGLTDADIPLTTDSLLALCESIKSRKVPFIFCMEDNYIEPMINIFVAQYEGTKNYTNYLNGIDPDGNVTEYIFSYDGVYEMLNFFEQWVKKSNGYQHEKSDAVDFTQMQGLFLKDEALFCVNGTWLENEMKNLGTTSEIDYVRIPVISSIINKLDTVNSDEQLIEVIKYIDAVDEGNASAVRPAYVSDDDLASVTEARHYSFCAGGVEHQAYIPSYAANIEQAKAFLKFMYSDKGLNVYYKTLGGATLPAIPVTQYDSSVTPSAFMKSSNDAFNNHYVVASMSQARYFALSGISLAFNNGSLGSALRNLYYGKTAEYVYNYNVASAKSKFNAVKDDLVN